MNKTEKLISKIKVIQKVLEEFHVEDGLIYGSMLKGTNHIFSDFDIAVKMMAIQDVVENNEFIFARHVSSKRWCHLILEEAGVSLRYALNMDVNLNLVFNVDEYETSSIFVPRLEIIKNGISVPPDELACQIEEIQKMDFTVKENRGEAAQRYYVDSHLASFTSCARYYSYIDSLELFLEPQSIEEITMRNETIGDIAKLCAIVDKVEPEYITNIGLPYTTMKLLNQLIKKKQVEAENFNPSALGWDVCCSKDLDIEELILIGHFYLGLKEGIFEFLNLIKDSKHFRQHYDIYQRFLEDEEGFLFYLKKEYEDKTNPQNLATPFKNLLDVVMY